MTQSSCVFLFSLAPRLRLDALFFQSLVLRGGFVDEDRLFGVMKHVVAHRTDEKFANASFRRGCENDRGDFVDEFRFFHHYLADTSGLHIVRDDVDHVREFCFFKKVGNVVLNPLNRLVSLCRFLLRVRKVCVFGQCTIKLSSSRMRARQTRHLVEYLSSQHRRALVQVLHGGPGFTRTKSHRDQSPVSHLAHPRGKSRPSSSKPSPQLEMSCARDETRTRAA